MVYFYRFRSAHALLDGFHELDEQVIHFAPTGTLNDPMEGYKELFWQGDAIVWRNLFHHYLLCLLQAFPTTLLSQKDHLDVTGEKFIFATHSDLPTQYFKDVYAEVRSTFFGHEKIAALPSLLAARPYKLRRPELLFLLRAVQGVAFKVTADILRRHKMLPPLTERAPPSDLDGLLDRLTRSLTTVGFADPEEEEVQLRAVFDSMSHVHSQVDLISYSRLAGPMDRAFFALARQFPERYAKALDRLLYHDWAAACFVSDPNQAAMWGTYGDGHKGLCLKFKAADGVKPSLMLQSISGWSGDRSGMHPVWGRVGFVFEELNYVDRYPEIDFFRSMGVLPEQVLRREWYADEHGQHSICAEWIHSDPVAWRRRYLEAARDVMFTKFRDWNHEKEYRLVLTAHAAPLDSLEYRKLKYDFADLEGVIFGINTPMEVKLKVSNIIERKCKETGRASFEFGQAWYSAFSGKVETRALDLLKFP